MVVPSSSPCPNTAAAFENLAAVLLRSSEARASMLWKAAEKALLAASYASSAFCWSACGLRRNVAAASNV